jgi:hypothetical protein
MLLAPAMKTAFLLSLLLTFAAAEAGTGASPKLPAPGPATSQISQMTPLSFNSWRPYKNPYKIVQVGMNKGQVLALAGKPDHEESYYQGTRGRLLKISDWYYVMSGLNLETALLKFSQDTLVSISVTPVQ